MRKSNDSPMRRCIDDSSMTPPPIHPVFAAMTPFIAFAAAAQHSSMKECGAVAVRIGGALRVLRAHNPGNAPPPG
ncbi:MAG TPA: hypothetical protein VHA82_15765 [Ramlibacter sp.]|uniref:hypothetical protein n=1 Tax=Ramlibacter sp. TaxID=1917967 RepID=UPI002BBF965E|nr:hypothetical protein [Ramlibacter sp.]HVZ45267.1 hypothetical protein [Ramlibacter sp.]